MSMATAELLDLFSHHIKLLNHRLEDFVGKILGLNGVRGTINVNTDNATIRESVSPSSLYEPSF